MNIDPIQVPQPTIPKPERISFVDRYLHFSGLQEMSFAEVPKMGVFIYQGEVYFPADFVQVDVPRVDVGTYKVTKAMYINQHGTTMMPTDNMVVQYTNLRLHEFLLAMCRG